MGTGAEAGGLVIELEGAVAGAREGLATRGGGWLGRAFSQPAPPPPGSDDEDELAPSYDECLTPKGSPLKRKITAAPTIPSLS